MTDHPFHALDDGPTADYRGEPTFQCPCGCAQFLIVAVFDEEERLPGYYCTDAMCAACGALLTAPCPVDYEMEGIQ